MFLLVPIFLWRSVVEQQNIEYYKDIIENAETEKAHIKEDFELFKDTVIYNKKMNEFNEKYQKAVEYLNSHNQQNRIIKKLAYEKDIILNINFYHINDGMFIR